MSSFGINRVNPIPALTAPFPLIFLPKLFIAFAFKLLTNQGKLYLAKRIAIFVSAFFPKLPNQEPKDLPDWIILDIWALLSFISADIFLAKAFLILVVCLVVRYNSCVSLIIHASYLFLIFFLSYILVQILICLIVYLLV